MNTDDYRDLVIEDLATETIELRERIGSLEADVAAYRELAHQAIHRLHDVTQTLRRATDQHRYLREQVMREAMQRRTAA